MVSGFIDNVEFVVVGWWRGDLGVGGAWFVGWIVKEQRESGIGTRAWTSSCGGDMLSA